ncbi:MAG TPA: hypothetical protein VF774_18700 [Pseudoduganella sp.]|jgi:hypothetical protein
MRRLFPPFSLPPLLPLLPPLVPLLLTVPLLCAARPCMAAPPAPAAVLTMAEGPVRLIRGAVLYRAAAGIAVQADDILETAGGGAQVEAGPAILALGPATRLLLARLPGTASGGIEIALLEGWAKVAIKAGAAAAGQAGARVMAPTLAVTLPAGVTIVRSQGANAAVFAEEGGQQLAPAGGKPGAPVRLATEQYGTFVAGKPFVGRPAADFLAALPPAFRDALAPANVAPKAGRVALVKERDAAFADVADWLRAPPPLRKGFVARFRPRLGDGAFRRELAAELGDSADWRPVLRPPARRPAGELF